ncbi:fec operon regulator FecR [Tannerella forsythia]|uniref:FecR family protein n=1 Tax=Tannerella forsythia TaxID=28112 RepID=UPI00086EB09F|nr:FecR family protein [Tannerella forsythia]SCQ23174.1 fec operon regulator FecR [Tannerella forsythia]
MKQNDTLIIKYLTGSASFEEQAVLLKWLEESETNKRHFRSMKDAYDSGRLKYEQKNSCVQSQWDMFRKNISVSRNADKRLLNRFSWMRYVAVFILGMLLVYWIRYIVEEKSECPVAQTRIETGVGDKSKTTLPDGTVVWLNACSSLLYGDFFGKSERTVYLKGEAYFEVKTDKQRPFSVCTERLTYRVTGTSFNVYAFEEEETNSVALLEGGVTVESGKWVYALSPGEVFTYDKNTGTFTVEKKDVEHLSSWRRGEFVFDKMTFGELIHRLERLYHVKFVCDNLEVQQTAFGGTLKDYDSLETVMNVLKTSLHLSYTIEENTVFIR